MGVNSARTDHKKGDKARNLRVTLCDGNIYEYTVEYLKVVEFKSSVVFHRPSIK